MIEIKRKVLQQLLDKRGRKKPLEEFGARSGVLLVFDDENEEYAAALFLAITSSAIDAGHDYILAMDSYCLSSIADIRKMAERLFVESEDYCILRQNGITLPFLAARGSQLAAVSSVVRDYWGSGSLDLYFLHPEPAKLAYEFVCSGGDTCDYLLKNAIISMRATGDGDEIELSSSMYDVTFLNGLVDAALSKIQ